MYKTKILCYISISPFFCAGHPVNPSIFSVLNKCAIFPNYSHASSSLEFRSQVNYQGKNNITYKIMYM